MVYTIMADDEAAGRIYASSGGGERDGTSERQEGGQRRKTRKEYYLQRHGWEEGRRRLRGSLGEQLWKCKGMGWERSRGCKRRAECGRVLAASRVFHIVGSDSVGHAQLMAFSPHGGRRQGVCAADGLLIPGPDWGCG
jgi:hypothetical protein